MKKLSKNKNIALIFMILTVFTTVFIFSNSLRVGEESSKQSDGIVKIVEAMAKFAGIDFDRTSLSHFIRKLGHFTEYFLLGAVSASAIASWFESRKFIVFAPIYSLIVAICDEFIFQRITEGRGPQWTDVLIDFCGSVVAVAVIFIIFTFTAKKIKKAPESGKRK